MTDFWTMMSPSVDGASLVEELGRLEGLGFTGVVAPQVYAPPFAALSAAAIANQRLNLGTGIAIALTRSPFETACSAIELDRISAGRLTLGLGVGPRHWVHYFGSEYSQPLSRVREVIEVVRHVEACATAGDMKPFQGKFWQLEFENFQPFMPPVRKKIPIYIAALRERVCEMVGEIADGLIGHPVWSVDYALGTAQTAVARGAKRANRNIDDIAFQPYVTVSIDENENRAVQLAKPFIAFYAGFAQYHSYFDEHGFGEVATGLANALKTQHCREAAALVPDEMARTFAACGTEDQVREWIAPLKKTSASMVLLTPGWGLTGKEIAEKQHSLEEFVARETG